MRKYYCMVLFIGWIILTMAIVLTLVGIIYLLYYQDYWFELPNKIFDHMDRV